MKELNWKINFRNVFSGSSLSAIYVFIFAGIVLSIIFLGTFHSPGKISEGDISLRSIYAPYDFRYPWGVDRDRTAESRERARRGVPLIFTIDQTVEDDVLDNLSLFFSGLNDIADIKDKGEREMALSNLKSKTEIDMPDNICVFFADRKDKEQLRTQIGDILSSVFPLGVVNETTIVEFGPGVKFIKIVNPLVKAERLYKSKDVLTLNKAIDICKEYAARMFSRDIRLRNYATDLITALVKENVVYDKEETEKLRNEATKAVKPVYNMVEVKKNELIMEKGQRVTERHIVQLVQLGIIGGAMSRGAYLSGMTILLTIFLFLSILYLNTSDKKLVRSPKEVLIILLNCILILVVAQFVIQSPQPSYIIPIAGVSMLIALLVNANVAFMSSIVIGFFIGLIAGGKMDVTLVMIVGGFTGAYVARNARRRSKIILAGTLSGVFQMITTIGFGLTNNLDAHSIIYSSCWGLAGGIISIFIVMGLLPIYEYIFKITTDITLLELSDLNHPLLKELTLKAPGTYQHSIMVGNLAEAACEAIGANSLMARVGAYYHDIGKMGKAEYFSENEMGAVSKHEKLTPSMSALIIVNHVKDGVALAEKYKLNTKILEFIEQHHGTSIIYYFYHRALEKNVEEEVLNEEEFRYPGPKPQNKETAIVLLADSVEASSRTLSDPTPARIKSLVQKIINNKFIDKQLDECDLTLTDINKISDAFVRLLIAMFHTRVEYPDRKDIQQAKRANEKNRHQQHKFRQANPGQ